MGRIRRGVWAAVAAGLVALSCALPADAAASDDGDSTPLIVVGTLKRIDAEHFRVDVEQVLNKGRGRLGRTTVMTTSAFGENGTCRWLSEKIPAKRRYLVDITVRRREPVVDQCTDIRARTATSLRMAQRELERIEPTAPPAPTPIEPLIEQADAVGYPDFPRLAAPGLAVVIIGLLGLFVVRRVDRP